MAIAQNSIVGAPRRVAFLVDGEIAIEFDATLSEDHRGTAEITSHPVEQGADVTDHIRRAPEELTINAIVTDNPIPIVKGASVQTTPGEAPIITGGTLIIATSVPGGNPKNRAQDAFNLLRRFKDQGQLVRVVTRLRDYPQMAIASLGVTRDASSANIVDIALTMREVAIAVTELVDAPEPIPVKKPRKNQSNQGKKNKKDAPPVNNDSVAAGIFGVPS